MEQRILPIEDIIEVMPRTATKADEGEKDEVKTAVVDSLESEVKDEVKADEGIEKVNEAEPKSNNDVVIADDEPADDDIVGLNTPDSELPKHNNEIVGEVIDSDVIENEDVKRDAFLAEAREICDSADFGNEVKIPHFENRETYRSALYKFCKLNPKFVNVKYRNLRIDSYTNELCDEVKDSVFDNIKAHKPKVENVGGQWIDSGKGYRVMADF